MKNSLLMVSEGMRLAFTSTKNRIVKPKKYSGSVENICRDIINDCFDKKRKYFRVSPHNFKQFYARDFGMCCESLLKLGYKTQVRQTLIYAMSRYVKKGKITTQINPYGHLINFPSHTPESASYMLHSLILLDDKVLIKKYKPFFEKISSEIYEEDIDKKTGLLRKDKHFSSMKDHSLRESSCYNNCLLAMFANDLKKINAKSSLTKYNYRKTIARHFLRKSYFLEDLSGSNTFAGDANVFPFWTNLYDTKSSADKALYTKIIKKIRGKKMDSPWPLRYTTKEDAPKKMHITNILCPGYETDTLWMHLGLCYIKSIKNVDPLLYETYLDKYELLIKKHRTFYEVYDTHGKKFSRLLYKSDEAMLWCSIFLEMYIERRNKAVANN